jgi:oligoendopeptidase F
MPIAETASTLCETIVIGDVLKKADKGTALAILDNDLSGIMQTLSDIYSRFLFEDSVFKLRAEGMLSADKLCSLMLSAQQTAYGDKLDKDYMHPYMWVCKPHYYDAEFNYYNFPYAFGMLLSKALYAKSQTMGADFVPLYDALLSATGTNDLEEVAKLAGFDLRDEAFWQTGIKIIKDEIEEYKSLI